MLSNEQKLSMVNGFDEMNYAEKDNVASLVGQEIHKRIREVTDEDVMSYHKNLLKQMFNEKCDAEIENGFISSVNGHHYRTNRDDQINFIGLYLLVRDDEKAEDIFWTTEDAGPLPLEREEFMMIYFEALKHKNDTIRKYWLKKGEIDACESHLDIREIVWEDVVLIPKPVTEEPAEEPIEEPVEDPIQEPDPETPEETKVSSFGIRSFFKR